MMVIRAFLLGFLFASYALAASDRPAARPNVLFITVDQLPWHYPGFAGFELPHAQTPNMDALAAEGVTFNSHFVDATTCHPSRSSMMTGRPPTCHGAIRNGARLPESETTLAEVLGADGYATAALGKVHSEEEGSWQGFDLVLDRDRWKRSMRKLGYESPADAVWWISEKFQTGVNLLPDTLQFDPLITNHAINFIDAQGPKPWFTYVSYKGPHSPWYPTPEGWEGVSIGDVATPVPDEAVWTTKPQFQQDRFDQLHFDELTRRDSELHHLAFVAHVELVDQEIGRLLDHLRGADGLDRTIVVLTSDHGDMAGTLGIFDKNFGPYHSVARVPCVLRYPPSFSAPVTIDHLTQGSDLMPTICELVGVAVPTASMGVSLLGLASGGPAIHSHIFTVNESYDISRMVSDGRYVFVQNLEDINEFYDLTTDPGQELSVLDAPEYAERVNELQAALDAWRDAGCDP